MKTRDNTFDIAKGIGILLVVLGHMPTLLPEFLLVWIKGFHMPLFFFISGYFTTPEENISAIKMKLTRKLKTILLPYFLYSLLFAAVDTIALGMNRNIFRERMYLMLSGSGGYYMLWFLFSLFLVEVIFYLITYLFKNEKIRSIVISLFVLTGFLLKHIFHYNHFKLGTSFYIIGIFYIGYLCKSYKKLSFFSSTTWTIVGIGINLLGTCILYKLSGYTLELVDNQTVDILLNYLVALSAIIVILNLSRRISQYRISSFLGYLGLNSLYFYPLTGYIPDLAKIIFNDTKIIKILSRLFSFIFTYGFLEIKKQIKKHNL